MSRRLLPCGVFEERKVNRVVWCSLSTMDAANFIVTVGYARP